MSLDPKARRIRREIDHHLEELVDQLVEDGLTPEEARAEARRRFGDRGRIERAIREAVPLRDRGRPRLFDPLGQDLRYGVRQLVARPLMSVLTIVTIVVGVAATAVVFSVVHAVVLQPLPFPEPDRLVEVNQTSPQGRPYSVSEPNFVDFSERQQVFEAMAGLGFVTAALDRGGEAVAVEAMRVSHDFFSLFGVAPTVGRPFSEAEDRFGGPGHVAVLSEGAWERRYGHDPAVIGATVLVDGVPHEVVGIAPTDRAWPGVELYLPLAPNPVEFRDDQRLMAVARLADGIEIEDARVELSRIAADVSVAYPQSNDGWGALVTPLRDTLVGPRLSRLGTVLLAVVGVFLLMACASVSNLLLTRATTRTEEIGVRAALGAGRARIVRQLVTEGAVLALVGGGLAVAAARPALAVVRAVGPADVTRLGDATVNGTVLLVATGTALATVLAAGLAPALLLVRDGMYGALRSGGRAGTSPGRGTRNALVVAQYTLAVTVLLTAGLLTRSFQELQSIELGFEPEGVVRFAVRLPDTEFDQLAREDFLLEVASELRALPSVVAVGATTASPFHRWRPSNFVARSDREPDRQEEFVPVSWRAVTGEYFEAAGIALLAGRVFGSRERGRASYEPENPAVIIDETLARALFPDGESPVGRLVTWFLPGGRQCEIVGVVASARDERLDGPPRPRIYRPFTFSSWEEPNVLVRTNGDPAALVPAIRRVVGGIDPSIPVIAPAPMSADLRASVAWPRFSMQVLSVFGFVALGLAALGIYGVTSFAVARRRREIGVRTALGADPHRLRWLVLRSTIKLAFAGIAIGIVGSIAGGRLLEAILYDAVSSTDPVTFVSVPAILAGVALLAAWVPARRAVRIDPRIALTSDT